MVEIGGKPILWHIMKIYSSYGINDFVICCGYKGYYIKEYFSDYFLHESDVTFDFRGDKERITIHEQHAEPWRVTLVDTGLKTETGGRLLRARKYIEGDTFLMTYGDGVSDIDISSLIAYHKKEGKKVTVTAIRPMSRYGALTLDNSLRYVTNFHEKPLGDGNFISGGFFVLEPEILEYIAGDDTTFEREPLERLANEGQIAAYLHRGYWQSMDTLRDKIKLGELWEKGDAPWKVWE